MPWGLLRLPPPLGRPPHGGRGLKSEFRSEEGRDKRVALLTEGVD